MKKFYLLAVALFIVGACAIGAGQVRTDQQIAHESSIVPTQEATPTKITISDDNDHTLDLTQFGLAPLILMVRGDGDFHEGATAPSQSNDIWRDSGQIWAIPVSGRATWHFKRRTNAGTVTLYCKVYGSN